MPAIIYTDEKVLEMHPRQQAVLLPVPVEARNAVVGRAHLLQNLQGGIFSQALAQAARELVHVGSPEALEELSRKDNHAAMRACGARGCAACQRDADRLAQS